jgi:hypothetical protein
MGRSPTRWQRADSISLVVEPRTVKESQGPAVSKLTDTLKAALEKKKGIHHVEPDGAPAVEKKAKKTGAATPVKKPPAKSAGRGR